LASIIIDLLYAAALVLGWPWLVYRRYKRGPGSLALGERLGDVPTRDGAGPCVWVHGVSLGEINAARTIVAEIRKQVPGAAVVISSTTQTGMARARQIFWDHIVFRFPLDFSFVLKRVLRRLRPSAIVLMELEVWPNLIEIAHTRGIPLLIANGRVTEEKSMKRFGRPIVRGLARRMFGKIAWIGAQDETYADRFRRLGVPAERVEIVGSVKYDAADVSDRIAGQDELAAEMGIAAGRPLLVCGSTGDGEEALILDAYERVRRAIPEMQLALIPRKPERFDAVAELIAARGYACRRRSGKAAASFASATSSAAPSATPRDAAGPVFLGDTMGELRKFYSLATVIFVGRSLVPMGGSDLMEAAGLAKPVLFGPHTDNFNEVADLLVRAGGGRRVADAAALAAAALELSRDREAAGRMGSAARRTIVEQRGATGRTVGRIAESLR
jgi:3-deoxy-D-manno-octulosonic-acid transferase